MLFFSSVHSILVNPPNFLPFYVFIKDKVGPLFLYFWKNIFELSPSSVPLYNNFIFFISPLLEIHLIKLFFSSSLSIIFDLFKSKLLFFFLNNLLYSEAFFLIEYIYFQERDNIFLSFV